MAILSDKGTSYTAGFFMLIAFAIGGMIFGGMVSIPVLMMMTGNSVGSISEILMSPNANYLREMQVVQSLSAIFGFLLPTIFAASRLSNRPMKLTGFVQNITSKQILLSILIILCGVGLSSALGYMSYQIPFPADWKSFFSELEMKYGKMAENLINLNSPFELFISIIVLALLPAVCEETLFRGGLQNYMYRSSRKMWLSIIVVSLIFSAVHFSVYGFLSRFVLGVVLGLIFHYSGSLWLSILAHFVNNATAVMAMYFQKASGKTMIEIMNDKEGSYIGFLAVPVIVLLFIAFKRSSRPVNLNEHVLEPAQPTFIADNKNTDGI